MIRLLEVDNFRMLRRNRVALQPFCVLVGQNATGKSTFLGALQFVADILQLGVRGAVRKLVGTRAGSLRELCFAPEKPIAFALEVSVQRSDGRVGAARYELEIGVGSDGELSVLREHLFVLPDNAEQALQPSLFGDDTEWPAVIHEKSQPKSWRKVVSKTREGKDYFRDEKTDWNNVFRFGPERAALGSLPEDLDRFPLSIAVRDLLRAGVRTVALDAAQIRSSSPPGSATKLALDGSNLPDVARALKERDPIAFAQWVRHVGSGVVGLRDVDIFERDEDKHLVLRASFSGAHAEPVPSWLLSDGTLRLMALTLLAFSTTDANQDVYLIEEPENGLHPLALQAAYDALSRPGGGAQVLVASHSPILLSYAKLDEAIVFRRAKDGAAIVRRGPEVPELRDWQGRTNLADLFVTGVLS